MDAFELARQKHAKNLERRNRSQGVSPAITEMLPVVPKEKSTEMTSAVIEVKVTLPNGEFSFTLVKPSVFQNANPSKLTKAEFMNRIKSGLEPLLGGLK